MEQIDIGRVGKKNWRFSRLLDGFGRGDAKSFFKRADRALMIKLGPSYIAAAHTAISCLGGLALYLSEFDEDAFLDLVARKDWDGVGRMGGGHVRVRQMWQVVRFQLKVMNLAWIRDEDLEALLGLAATFALTLPQFQAAAA